MHPNASRRARTLRPQLLRTALAACALLAGCSSGVDDESGAPELTSALSGKPSPRRANPVVLVHGFNAAPEGSDWSFVGVAAAFELAGYKTYTARVEPFNSVAVRAGSLKKTVDEALAGCGGPCKVNLVAHSMGGLDSRYLTSSLGYGAAGKVASVTTVGTPHNGSNVADMALGLFASDKLNDVASLLAETFGAKFTNNELAANSNLRAAFEGLSEAAAPAFNEANREVAGVRYFSWAGISYLKGFDNPLHPDERVRRTTCLGRYRMFESADLDTMSASLTPNAAVVSHGASMLPNDGMVTVASAVGPAREDGTQFEFRACFPADHLDEVGHVDAHAPKKMNHVALYRAIAADLVDAGL